MGFFDFLKPVLLRINISFSGHSMVYFTSMTESIEERVQKIEARNQNVEMDKAWETSWTRRALLMLFTYVAVGAYLWVILVPRPWINAIVPAVGFMISTLTMPFFKKQWLRYISVNHGAFFGGAKKL